MLRSRRLTKLLAVNINLDGDLPPRLVHAVAKGTLSETTRVGRTGRRLDVDDGVGEGQ